MLFNNGALYSTVQNLGDGEARLLITQAKDGGQTIYENCGINVPGTALNLPAVTAEDEKLLEATVSFASLVEVSFVRTAQDMRDAVAMVRRVEQRSGRNVGIVVKLETVEAVGALLSAMDGVQRKNQSLLPSLHEWKR